jgi:hypothetical protein
VLFATELRFELSYDLPAAVGARPNKDAAALSDCYYVAVARVRFLASPATRLYLVGVADALYGYYACQYSLRGS